MARLSVRWMTQADVPLIVRYWVTASPEDLARMAADGSKIPAPDVLSRQLEALVAAPSDKTSTAYSVWLIDDHPVGYSSLKGIVYGAGGEMHLHMWDPGVRGRGYGAELFCRSALAFYERFRLRYVICEPSRANPMPNGMLRRIGFRLVGARVGASSELSLATELNTYAIERHVAERFLAERHAAPLRGA